MSTPLSPHPETSLDPENALTQGELLSQLQVRVLKKERFVSVLGAHAVDSFCLDWEKIGNPDAAFDDSQRIIATHSLSAALHARLLFEPPENSEFRNLVLDLLQVHEFRKEVHRKRLERVAIDFFQRSFPKSTLNIGKKKAGVQMGLKASVTLMNGETRKYHVKTHSLGLLAERSSSAQSADPQELMVYKILEQLGFGCETFFLQRSLQDVYIATLDGGHGGSFQTFDTAAGVGGRDNDRIYGNTLWGVLQDNHEDASLNDAETVEAAIESDPVAHNFMEQVTAIDLISRILRVRDLLNNTQNFGFFVSAGKPPALKIIDFRISDGTHFDYEQFRGFLAGNGKYCYTSSHRTLRYGLHDRPVSNRVHAALHCLSQGSLCNFHQCIDQAYQDVLKYVSEAQELKESVVPFSNRLDAFQVALHTNVNIFKENLERYEVCTLHSPVETFGDPNTQLPGQPEQVKV
jgi:hypothetical protein